MLGDVNKLFVFKSLLTMSNNLLLIHLKQTFPLIIWIFIESEGDGIQFRLPFKKLLSIKLLVKLYISTKQKEKIPLCWSRMILHFGAKIKTCLAQSMYWHFYILSHISSLEKIVPWACQIRGGDSHGRCDSHNSVKPCSSDILNRSQKCISHSYSCVYVYVE